MSVVLRRLASPLIRRAVSFLSGRAQLALKSETALSDATDMTHKCVMSERPEMRPENRQERALCVSVDLCFRLTADFLQWIPVSQEDVTSRTHRNTQPRVAEPPEPPVETCSKSGAAADTHQSYRVHVHIKNHPNLYYIFIINIL